MFAKWFGVIEDRFDKEKTDATAEAYRRALSSEMGTQLFVIAAQRIFKHNTFFPSPQEFIDEASKVRRAKRSKREAEAARRRAEAIKKRRAREAREEFPDALLTGKRVAQAVADGEYELQQALPADTEASYRKADTVEENDSTE